MGSDSELDRLDIRRIQKDRSVSYNGEHACDRFNANSSNGFDFLPLCGGEDKHGGRETLSATEPPFRNEPTFLKIFDGLILPSSRTVPTRNWTKTLETHCIHYGYVYAFIIQYLCRRTRVSFVFHILYYLCITVVVIFMHTHRVARGARKHDAYDTVVISAPRAPERRGLTSASVSFSNRPVFTGGRVSVFCRLLSVFFVLARRTSSLCCCCCYCLFSSPPSPSSPSRSENRRDSLYYYNIICRAVVRGLSFMTCIYVL